MRLSINRIEFENFKGLRKYTFEPKGQSASAFADNGCFKTTLADGIYWILTGKDSEGKHEFEIKTLTPEGEAIHGLEHSVEMTLSVDGSAVTLKKVYKELWTKKRQKAERVFSGHTVDHFTNGIPAKKGEYDAFVADLISEDRLRLLADPFHFLARMHWTDRRNGLLDLAGGMSLEEVIASDTSLAKLPEILDGREIEDHKKVIKAKRKEINEELERLPVRITEVEHNLPDLPEGADKDSLEADIASLRAKRTAKDEERLRIQSGGEVAEKSKRLAEIDVEMAGVRSRVRADIDKKIEAERETKKGIDDQADAKEREQTRLQGEIVDAESGIKSKSERADALREEWHKINAEEFPETFEHDSDHTCAACGQGLPASQVAAAQAKAMAAFEERQANFNQWKAEKLANIQADGKRLAEEKQTLTAIVTEKREAVAQAQADYDALYFQSAQSGKRIQELWEKAPDPADDPQYQALSNEKGNIESAIAELRKGNLDALGRLHEGIKAIDQRIAELQADLSSITQREKGEARIAELASEEKRLAAEFEKLESEVDLMERFTMTEADLIETKVNGMFELVRFRMFNRNVDGGIEPTCRAIVGGVPYDTSLNGGAKINAGLDVLRVLQRHYDTFPVVIVDGCESCTRPLEMDCQLIKLVASEPDKELRVEYEETREEAAIHA